MSTPVVDPYYAATHTYCTRETLSEDRFGPLPSNHELRLADMTDIQRAAELCYGFASGSEPFVLSREDAFAEARGMIQARQLFVYNITMPNGSLETSSIVCVTRTSGSVSAITKVFTNPNHRGKGYAERLVRFVCQQ
jgi:predicted GNAT family acetyltransferase